MMLVELVFAVLLGGAVPVQADIVNCPFDRATCRSAWDFETGRKPPSSGFDNSMLRRGSFEIREGDAFDGARYGRVTVRPGNIKMVGRNKEKTERAEIMTKRRKSHSGVIHMGVALRFPAEFRPHDDRTLILQIKSQLDRKLKASPQFAIYANKSFDRWKVCNNVKALGECDYQQGRLFKRGKWHRILVSQNASKKADGWLKLFVDGRLVYHHKGPTKYNAKEIFTTFRVGIYRNRVGHAQSLDVDNFIVSRDLAAVKAFLKLR